MASDMFSLSFASLSRSRSEELFGWDFPLADDDNSPPNDDGLDDFFLAFEDGEDEWGHEEFGEGERVVVSAGARTLSVDCGSGHFVDDNNSNQASSDVGVDVDFGIEVVPPREACADLHVEEHGGPIMQTDECNMVGAKRGMDDVNSHASREDTFQVKKLKRGQHVKGRSEMQAKAREGQRHWATKVLELRAEWHRKGVEAFDPAFGRQVWLCERARAKPQRECILLALQLATVEGVIAPLPFISAHGSLGWSGFRVCDQQTVEFRTRMTAVFPPNCQPTSVNNAFRRAGFAAEGTWDRAWRGLEPFVHCSPANNS